MARRSSAAARRARAAQTKTAFKLAAVIAVLVAIGSAYFIVASSRRSLDEVTLCPSDVDAVTVLLVDLTDPLTLPQRQDLQNQLESLRNQIPRYGKLTILQVSPTTRQLLNPLITRCNPGAPSDESEWTGDPEALRRMREEGFEAPLERTFSQLTEASGARQSPIMESIQSAALTELQRPELADKPRRLILISDLLQNTEDFDFYGLLPDAQVVIDSPAFRSLRTDLRGVDVELWMLQRPDAARTQPRRLIELWDQIIRAQGGTVTRAYNVSG